MTSFLIVLLIFEGYCWIYNFVTVQWSVSRFPGRPCSGHTLRDALSFQPGSHHPIHHPNIRKASQKWRGSFHEGDFYRFVSKYAFSLSLRKSRALWSLTFTVTGLRVNSWAVSSVLNPSRSLNTTILRYFSGRVRMAS